MRITMYPHHGIGWACWSVFASVPGVHFRMLTQGLTKSRAANLVERVNRLLNSQEANRVPDGRHLTIVHGTGIGHGHWLLVWNVEREKPRPVFADSLTKQAARTTRDELNAIIDAIRELRFSATVLDCLKKEVANNALLLSQGEGPAVQTLLRVNEELERQILRLKSGRSLEKARAA